MRIHQTPEDKNMKKTDVSRWIHKEGVFAKQFKGYCKECGEYVQKKANCPKLKNKKKNHKKTILPRI